MPVNIDLSVVIYLLSGVIAGVAIGVMLLRGARQRLELLLREEKTNVSQLTEKQNETVSQLRETESKLQQQGLELATLQTREQAALENLSNLESRKISLVEENKSLKSDVARWREDAKVKTSLLEENQKQLQEAHQRLSKSEVELNARIEKYEQLLAEFNQLKTQQEERDKNHRRQVEQFEQQKKELGKEFENLANRIFEEKGVKFGAANQQSIENLLKPFREQISDFRQRIDKVHQDSNESSVGLIKELEQLKKMNLEMTEDARNLTRALKGDKKAAGNWGEMQLEKTLQLAGLVKGDHYESQSAFKDDQGNRLLPDFVVKLPDNKHLIIDSKVSLVDYDEAVAAQSEATLIRALDAHVKAVKNHIDSLAGKDYSNLVGIRSPSFVLMFMPIEAAYIEALKHNKSLFNYGYERNVIMVSHTTLMPILRTVANLWMNDHANTEARALADRAGEIYNQVCVVAERLQKLGGSMRAMGNHYNDTVKSLAGKQGLHGKVERFQQLSGKANKSMVEIEPTHMDLETDKLELIAEPVRQPLDDTAQSPSVQKESTAEQ